MYYRYGANTEEERLRESKEVHCRVARREQQQGKVRSIHPTRCHLYTAERGDTSAWKKKKVEEVNMVRSTGVERKKNHHRGGRARSRPTASERFGGGRVTEERWD